MSKDAYGSLINVNVESIMPTDDFRSASDIAIPFADIAGLSSAFIPMLDSFNSVATELPYPLYRAVDKNGNPLSLIYKIHGSDGYSTLIEPRNIARMQEVTTLPGVNQNIMPLYPPMLLMAAAVMQIEHKLDAIEEIQQDMYNFLKDAKHAELKGNLIFLSETVNQFKLHWNDDTYKNSAHIKALDIRQSAEQNLIFYQTQIKRRLKETKLLSTASALKDTVSDFEYYRLALYMYAFSAFSEVMMLGSFDKEQLDRISQSIRSRAYDYRLLYSECYEKLENDATRSLSIKLKDGLAAVNNTLGKAVAKAPLINKTQLDEKLILSAKWLSNIKNSDTKSLLNSFIQARENVVLPFLDSIKQIDKLYNEPHEILFDSKNLYLKAVDSE